jgi:hypothetical protein
VEGKRNTGNRQVEQAGGTSRRKRKGDRQFEQAGGTGRQNKYVGGKEGRNRQVEQAGGTGKRYNRRMNRPVGKSGNLRYRLQRIGSCHKLQGKCKCSRNRMERYTVVVNNEECHARVKVTRSLRLTACLLPGILVS